VELTCLHWQSYADDLTAELQSRVQARNQTGPMNVQQGSERIEVEQEDGLRIIHVSFDMQEHASRKQSNSADEVTGGSSQVQGAAPNPSKQALVQEATPPGKPKESPKQNNSANEVTTLGVPTMCFSLSDLGWGWQVQVVQQQPSKPVVVSTGMRDNPVQGIVSGNHEPCEPHYWVHVMEQTAAKQSVPPPSKQAKQTLGFPSVGPAFQLPVIADILDPARGFRLGDGAVLQNRVWTHLQVDEESHAAVIWTPRSVESDRMKALTEREQARQRVGKHIVYTHNVLLYYCVAECVGGGASGEAWEDHPIQNGAAEGRHPPHSEWDACLVASIQGRSPGV